MIDPSPRKQPHCDEDAGVVRQPQRIRQCREGFWHDRLDEPAPVGVRKRTECQGCRDKLPGTPIGTRRTNSYQAQRCGSPVGEVARATVWFAFEFEPATSQRPSLALKSTEPACTGKKPAAPEGAKSPAAEGTDLLE